MEPQLDTAPTPVVDTAPASVTDTPPPATPAPTAEVASTTPTPEAKADAPSFAIPEAYKDKPWASKVKTQEDLWKALDGAQSLIGKKTVIPDFATASEQEIEGYFNQLRPQDKAEYSFTDDTPAEDAEVYRDIFHESGLSKVQAEKLVAKYNEVMGKRQESLYSEEGMFAELEKSFGKNYKEVGAKVAASIVPHVSAEDKAVLDAMPNQYVGLIYRMANNMLKAYGASESGINANAPTTIAPADMDKVRTELRNKIAEISKGPHNYEDKKRLIDQLSATYAK